MNDPDDVQPAAAEPFRPHHTRTQKLILALNVFVVFVCLVGAVGLIFGKDQLDRRLQTSRVSVATTVLGDVPGPGSTFIPGTADSTVPSTTPNTFPLADPLAKNFLITGSDSNPCVSPDSPWAGAADPARETIGNRSDTIMVMRVDPTTRQAAVLSFPRDLWVKIPGKGKNRINAAYVKDDYSLLAATLYAEFGITVDHYLQVDFCAFKRIVDAVGGVAVPFDTPVFDNNINLHIEQPGCHLFGGDEALAYVRSRHLKWVDANGKAHEDQASDLGRISRQQDFLRRVMQAALKKGLFDPTVAQALIKSLQTEIVTEDGFTINDMLKFAGVLKDINPKGINTYQVEVSRLITGGRDVLEPKLKGKNMRAILDIFQGKAPLAGAPEQVFSTTTIAGGTVPDSSGPPTSIDVGATTVPAPDENVKGDIVPSENVVC
jgi:LCP family protein required for cell wall assembly